MGSDIDLFEYLYLFKVYSFKINVRLLFRRQWVRFHLYVTVNGVCSSLLILING